MPQYDFDQVIDRHHTGALKTDVLEVRYGDANLLPLWVADMDFATPPFIVDALRRRLEHPIFGYTVDPADYWPSVVDWLRDHHQWDVRREWLSFIPGIVKGIGFAVNVFVRPDEKVIIQPPSIIPSASPLRATSARWCSIRSCAAPTAAMPWTSTAWHA